MGLFKGFQDSSINPIFNGFPNNKFQMNNQVYGLSGCTAWFSAKFGLDQNVNLGAVSKWVDRISGASFIQTTAANQPRLLVADPNFNNNPSIDFYTNARTMSNSTGLSIDRDNVLAIVFRKQTNSSGPSGNRMSPILCDSSTVPTTNGVFASFANATDGTVDAVGRSNLQTGTAKIWDTTIGNTNPHIVIFSNLNMVADGVLLSPSGVSFAPFTATNISQGATNANIIMQLAEIVTWKSPNLSTTKMIALSDTINKTNNYAIY